MANGYVHRGTDAFWKRNCYMPTQQGVVGGGGGRGKGAVLRYLLYA